MSDMILPFGLRQVKLTPYKADGTLDAANAVFLPASRTFSFSETESFETLEGDDRTIGSHGAGPVVEWDLEGGGISFAAWKVLAGGTITSTGTTPAITKTFTKKITDSRPYFQVEGRSINDNGGDFTAKVPRCKADGDLESELANGSFALTKASGKGYGDITTGDLYTFANAETPVPLVVP